ncbi:glutaredoxin-C9-like [Cornus florida]|uniref:glutaredoxin-C9-like n=1 Tax=Cornus florida TaxID=4283 RepID=UPI00289E2D20|nr:glutaredoxin-C9-like [Cornus florida]
MQEAIPYKTWQPISTQTPINRSPPKTETVNGGVDKGTKEYVKKLVEENAVIVFGKRGCCMSHVVKRLLQGLGVNPAVFDVDEDDEAAVVEELQVVISSAGVDGKDGGLQFPAVFIGGRLFGGLERIMATHITGELIPILKEAGALWL